MHTLSGLCVRAFRQLTFFPTLVSIILAQALFLGIFCIKHSHYQPAPEHEHSRSLPHPTLQLSTELTSGLQGADPPYLCSHRMCCSASANHGSSPCCLQMPTSHHLLPKQQLVTQSMAAAEAAEAAPHSINSMCSYYASVGSSPTGSTASLGGSGSPEPSTAPWCCPSSLTILMAPSTWLTMST
jgi:hypothetical protein